MGERPDQGFADRLAALVEKRRSQIVLGLDPDPSALWPVAVGAGALPGGAAGDRGAGGREERDIPAGAGRGVPCGF